jgi:hypothetical protein
LPSINIKPTNTWETIPAGLLTTAETMALDRLEENFNNDALAAEFKTLVSGGGLAYEKDVVTLHEDNLADAAILYRDALLNKAVTDKYNYESRIFGLIAGVDWFYLSVQQNAGAPIVGNSGILAAKRVIDLAASFNTTNFLAVYFDDIGNVFTWDGAAWQPGALARFGTYQSYKRYKATLDVDSALSRWRLIFTDLDTDTVITTTDWVLWANTRDIGGDDMWIITGDPFTNIYKGSQLISRYFQNYPSGTLDAIMGFIAVGSIIDQLPIIETIDAGASIVWSYDIGAGWITPGGGTLAELNAALVGTSPATLNLRARFSSDAALLAGALFDINGGVIACPAGFQATYELPQEIIVDDEEFVILEGCD